MAVTGLILVAFLLMHMFGNLKLLLNDGGVEFNAYANILQNLFYPVLPHMFFLWCFRILLTAAVVLHIWSAVKLADRRHRNVGSKRYTTRRYMEQSYAARTMLWGGIIIVLFVIMHLLQFTAQVLKFGYKTGSKLDPYHAVLAGFSQWWVVLIYFVSMVAVCVHISHGFYSAFTTLGANTSPKARSVLLILSWIVAALLFVGFMLPPFLILFGVIG
ncbi:MAG: succinate dehydrogenase cytochrome b subunit [Propionibacterium sp.]|nr:succinate dehydrogenase cytochrome b subunit [Propionibacterium sp.]